MRKGSVKLDSSGRPGPGLRATRRLNDGARTLGDVERIRLKGDHEEQEVPGKKDRS
jgi:hypothetical protein